jgi:hypothetical protein
MTVWISRGILIVVAAFQLGAFRVVAIAVVTFALSLLRRGGPAERADGRPSAQP